MATEDRGGRGRGSAKPALKQRARSFAFEGFPEKDRFGVFDPALRAWFVFGFMLAGVLSALGLLDVWGRTVSTGSAAVVLLLAIGLLGATLYRRIWRPPAEREILLRMAAEDDESRALRARLARERAAEGRESGAGAPQGRVPQKERRGEELRKAF